MKKFERALMQPITGIPIIFFLILSIFLFIGKFVAQTIVGFTQEKLLGTWYYNLIIGYSSVLVDTDSLVGCLLVGEYGLFTMVPIYLLGLLLPLVFSFYFILILLQDSGIFYRISLMLDKATRRIGLSGAAVIPIILGFGCVTAALISTASLPNKRERLITAILLCIAIPCSAQTAIIMAVISILPPKYLIIYSMTVALIFILSGWILNRLLPGRPSAYTPVFPPLIFPSLIVTLKKTAGEAKAFIIDALPTFALGGFLMAILNYTNSFITIHRWLSPITSGLLHLPNEASDLFVLAIIKKDMGAAMLYSILSKNVMNDAQITVTLVVMTLFVPCFASMMVLLKQMGPLLTCAVWLSSFAIAFITGSLVSLFLLELSSFS